MASAALPSATGDLPSSHLKGSSTFFSPPKSTTIAACRYNSKLAYCIQV